jgi:CheY-like chemotaxis protein
MRGTTAIKPSAARANQLMREVVAATRLGQKTIARELLRELQESDPNNEQALLWSAALAESAAEATGYLERVLQINPNNQQAINVLAMHRLNPPAARSPLPLTAQPTASHTPQAAPVTSSFTIPRTLTPQPNPAPAPTQFGNSTLLVPRPVRSNGDSKPAGLLPTSILKEPPPPARVATWTPTPAVTQVSPIAAPPAGKLAPAQPAPPSTPSKSATGAAAPANSKLASFHELLKKGWQCSICQASAPQIQRRCPKCGSLLALDDLQALAENRGADEKILNEALDEWQKRVTVEPTFEAWVNLARIYFNLNRSAEALPCLKKAVEMRPGETALQTAVTGLQQRRLLLAVDDSVTLRRILGIMLERHGYRVLTASDGMQALALLNEQSPDLILLDITMPRMDGYQVCKVIKQNPHTKQIPIVMLSGNDGFFDKVKGKLAGATDYITKPFEEASLAASVGKHLKPAAKNGR